MLQHNHKNRGLRKSQISQISSPKSHKSDFSRSKLIKLSEVQSDFFTINRLDAKPNLPSRERRKGGTERLPLEVLLIFESISFVRKDERVRVRHETSKERESSVSCVGREYGWWAGEKEDIKKFSEWRECFCDLHAWRGV